MVSLEKIISDNVLSAFRAGHRVALSQFEEGIHYDKVGYENNNPSAYFFLGYQNLAFTVSVDGLGIIREGIEFRISYQETDIFLGFDDEVFILNGCIFDELLRYLNKRGAGWKIEEVICGTALVLLVNGISDIKLIFDFGPDSEFGLTTVIIKP